MKSYNGKFDSILTLGRQFAYFNDHELKNILNRHGIQNNVSIEPKLSHISQLSNQGFLDDEYVLKKIGFKNVESVDYSDFEKCTWTHDLNNPVPEQYHNKYDYIVDDGTMEHVFDQIQVLKNIHLMLKEGGRIIHINPSSNNFDHSFYMYSPTFFLDYYCANKYQINDTKLIFFDGTKSPQKVVKKVYSYRAGAMGLRRTFKCNKTVAIFFSGTKKTESVMGQIPQQSGYVSQWEDEYSHQTSQVGKRSKSLKSILRNNLFTKKIYQLLQAVYRYYLNNFGTLKYLGKY
ncbi:MAG: methyltransferase domain-containing protein [Halobacteriovoraceae bacterium]|nr:methyltransferase domain-containing protein [Halobacteriovoraceae bacterium]